MKHTLEQLFVGNIAHFDDDARPTGIFKKPVNEAVFASFTGLRSDHQADLKNHGGREKAIHQFAQSTYPKLQAAHPEIATLLTPGSMGENLSAAHMSEENVHIGDVYRVGSATLEVSQPRTLCWKVNSRFGHSDLAQEMQKNGLTGWYYRVLAEGLIQAGDSIQLLHRQNTRVSISYFLHVSALHRPQPAQLEELIQAEGLNPKWRERLQNRLDWLTAGLS